MIPRYAALFVPALISLFAGTSSSTAAGTPGSSAPSGAGGDSAAVVEHHVFAPDDFPNPTQIDNPWLPMQPGMRLVYEGKTVEDDGTLVPHRVVINVTDLTKVVGGVRTVVTWDLDYSEGELVEAELAFFAQDKHGNVWRVGEYPEEYDGKKMIANPGWIHGIEGARAGILMKASPELGSPSYAEGWAPAVNWTDHGKVDQMGQKTCVPVKCYEDVLVIAESSHSEVNAQQLKYYARGVGNVRVGWRGAGEKTQETLELVKAEQLDAKGLAEVRSKALALEKSGYSNSKIVYASTPPAEHASVKTTSSRVREKQ